MEERCGSPSDVRKRCALRRAAHDSGSALNCGVAVGFPNLLPGRPKAFRTSGGIAQTRRSQLRHGAACAIVLDACRTMPTRAFVNRPDENIPGCCDHRAGKPPAPFLLRGPSIR